MAELSGDAYLFTGLKGMTQWLYFANDYELMIINYEN